MKQILLGIILLLGALALPFTFGLMFWIHPLCIFIWFLNGGFNAFICYCMEYDDIKKRKSKRLGAYYDDHYYSEDKLWQQDYKKAIKKL